MEKTTFLKKLKTILVKTKNENEYYEDFVSTIDIEKMYGYTGFISPDGTFYICSSIEIGEEIHGPWAHQFLLQEMKENIPDEEASGCLVENYNYVLFAGVRNNEGKMIIINAPEDPRQYTKEQQEVFNALCQYYEQEPSKRPHL